VGLAGLERVDERMLVEEVGLDQLDPLTNRLEVLVALRGRSPNHSEDLVPVPQEKLGQERAVLASDARDESTAARHAESMAVRRLSGRAVAVGDPV
jgi:hypothetical protein